MSPDFARRSIIDEKTSIRRNRNDDLNHKLGRPKSRNRTYGYEISNGDLLDHFSGKSTLYYSANPLDQHMLLMIDIDVQKQQKLGSPVGAKAFAQYCRDILFADFEGQLYFEPSTNGKGVHGYILLDTHVVDDGSVFLSHGEIKSIANRLERFLDAEAKRLGFDVEMVEVKGQPPYLERARGWHGQPSHRIVTCGQLAKIPRLQTNEDVQRLLDTSKLTVYGIEVMLDGAQQPAHPAIDSPKPKRATKRRTKATADNDSPKPATRQLGSTCMVTQAQIDAYPKLKQKFKEMGCHGLKTKSGYEVTANAEDFANYLLAAASIQGTMRDDEERFPQRRIRGLVDKIYEMFPGARPFNHHRWKVIREQLIGIGFIRAIDMKYQYIPDAPGGGNGMCWRLTEAALQFMSSVIKGAESRVEEKAEEKTEAKAEAKAKDKKNTNSVQTAPSGPPSPLQWWQKPRLIFPRPYAWHQSGTNSTSHAISA